MTEKQIKSKAYEIKRREQKKEYNEKYREENKEKMRSYQFTKENIIKRSFSNQKRALKKRNIDLKYSLEELQNFISQNQTTFDKLYDNYKESGYDKKLKPSIDRIDSLKDYSLDNIQILTWEENKIKGKDEYNRKLKLIKQMLNGGYDG